jgi:hypothetical protein
MKKTVIPNFKDKKELFAFLKANEEILITEKKFTIKTTDCTPFVLKEFVDEKGETVKTVNNAPIGASLLQSLTVLKTKLAMNTTNIMDSHKDVHIPGLWKKTLAENKAIKHLQEHAMQFDKIIADKKDLQAYTQEMNWLELGYKFVGKTEVLVFDSTIRKARNPFMFDQYANGYVDNHSVGMQYVKMVLCINEPNEQDYGANYEAWQKYFPMVVNQTTAEESGYFWAILEAKLIEGSAVPIGSNYATPTLDNNVDGQKSEPANHSQNQPRKRTGINYDYLLRNI